MTRVLCRAVVPLAAALTHAPSLGPVISEIARILRPGGAAVLSDIHPVAVATGGHAFFPTGERSRTLVRNELHWTAEYVDAFLAVGFEIRGCKEPVYESSFSDEAADEQIRRALHGGVTGLSSLWSGRCDGDARSPF